MKSFQLRTHTALFFGVLLAGSAQAASFSLSGDYRFGANLYTNLDLSPGTPTGSGNTSSFLENRFLLRPDVVIDDRFTLKSEWILMQLGRRSGNDVPEAFGTSLDGHASLLDRSQLIYLRRAYMEWASDWGIFRFGRQPKSWGLGLLYNAGTDPFSDYGTTVDRMGFQAMLGNLGINAGYEKGGEGLLSGDGDDIDVYEMSLDYSNPESLFDVGILYSRNVRARDSHSVLNSSHNFSVFSQKRWGNLQLGGELVSISQDSHPGDSRPALIGILAQLDYLPGALNLGFDFGYSSGNANGSYSFHPNYQPFLILYRQSLGPTQSPATVRGGVAGEGVGSAVANGSGNGALLVKGDVSYGFDSSRYVLRADAGWAQLGYQGSNASKNLGFELDMSFSQKWYENFKTHYALGMLFPGHAFGPSPQAAWGFQVRGALTF